MLQIKLLGIGCGRYKALKTNLQEALASFSGESELVEITEVNDLIRFGIGSTPALMFNNEVVVENRVASVKELTDILAQWQPDIDLAQPRQTILVPTDYSSSSRNAFEFAQSIATILNADIKVIHVYQPDIEIVNPYLIASNPDTFKIHETRLDKFVKKHTRTRPQNSSNIATKTTIATELLMGYPTEEILAYAKNKNPVLIVMGTTGQSGFLSKIFGSISSTISKKSDYPVMLIPDNCRYESFDNILYASNYTRDDEVLLKRVIGIGKRFNGNFHIVHVENPEGRNGYSLKSSDFWKIFKYHAPGLSYTFKKIESKDIAEGINRYVKDQNIDLVVMMTKHRSFWQNIAHRSVTRRMHMLSTKPILIVHFDI